MLKQVILAIVVGVITALVVALIGVILVAVGVVTIGAFVRGIAPILGIVAAVWYFFTNQTPAHI